MTINSYKMSVGKNIRLARDDLGMTQEELAGLCSLPPSAVSHYETGKRTPIARTIVSLADELEITTDQLLGRSPLQVRRTCPTCKGRGTVAEKDINDDQT